MGLTWNEETGTGTKALDGRTVRERLGAAERGALRQRISTAVRGQELADAAVWKQIKAKERGIPARASLGDRGAGRGAPGHAAVHAQGGSSLLVGQ